MSTQIPATLAIVFNAQLTQVLLIRKQKPVHHAGKLNGLGGKVEPAESHRRGVCREVAEEAGLVVPARQWRRFGTIKWTVWQVSLWTVQLTAAQEKQLPPQFADPAVGWYPVDQLPSTVVANLHWLIPLALDVHRQQQQKDPTHLQVQIRYTEALR